MPEPIDRLEAIQRIKNDFCSECDCEYGDASCKVCEYDFCIGILNEMPTIEPEVRRGRWVFQKGDNKETVDGWICTSCKSGFHTKVPYFEAFKYCPMCGARMDGGADNG